MALKVAPIALAALVVASPAGATALKTKTAQRDGVRATISWQPASGFGARNVRIEIAVDGKTVLARKLGWAVPKTVRVRDLDGDGGPEVLADFFTGGAHCCFFSRIYRHTASGYTVLKHAWGNVSYMLRDLSHDGAPELVSADDHFAYAFTSYASSAFPLQIWDYSHGSLGDVTRGYPALIRKDAARLWKEFLVLRDTERPDSRGILAAWMADKYLLREQAAGWKTMALLNAHGEFAAPGRNASWPQNGAYLAKLREFLLAHGYAGKS